MADTLNLSIYDDYGPEQGYVGPNQMTDDTAPMVRVWLPTNSALVAGDTIKLLDDRTAAGEAVLSADDVAHGYVEVAASITAPNTSVLTASAYSSSGALVANGSSTLTLAPADVTRTQMTDGGHTVSFADTSGLPGFRVFIQRYDASNRLVGEEATLNGYQGASGPLYTITPLGGGQYLSLHLAADANVISRHGTVFTSSGAVGNTLTARSDAVATAGANSGFVLTANSAVGDPLVVSYNAPGAPSSPQLNLAGKISSVTAQPDGRIDVAFDDFGTQRHLLLDPLHQSTLSNPTTPGAALIDNYGPQQGVVTNGHTDDTTPDVRVSVSETGEALIYLPELSGAYQGGTSAPSQTPTVVQVTSADVARGSVQATVTTGQGEGVYAGEVRFVDSDGLISPRGVYSFTRQSVEHQGTAGADTETATPEGSYMTGGAGADVFVFNEIPSRSHQITDFVQGTDKLDFRGLLAAAHYAGTDPFADGYITTQRVDGSASFDPDGRAGPAGSTLIVRTGGGVALTASDFVAGSSAPPADGGGSTGGGSTGGGSTDGQVYTSPGPGSSMYGGAGNDTFNASQGGDTITGGAGADLIVLPTEPWSPVHVLDFAVGADKLDLSKLFQASGYTGADPVADHYVYLLSDGADGTIVRFDRDGAGGNPQWPNTVVDLEHVSPKGLTWAQLSVGASTGGSTGGGSTGGETGGGSTGGGSTGGGSTGGSTGQVYTSPGPNFVETGTAGNDTFNASQGYDTLTGGGGNDVFVLGQEPWAPITVTDFAVGGDKLDLSALFRTAGYTGSDPVADHYILLASDGNGGTIVRYDHDGGGPNPEWPNTIVDLQNVSPSGRTWAQLSVAGGAPTGGGTTGGGDTGGSTGGGSGGGTTGQVYTSPGPNSVETGTAGNDTFNASQGYDTLTGGAGADVFNLPSEPWAPIHVTDFTAGTDKIDLRALFTAAGYSGSNPVADHYILVASDGNGGSIIRFDHDGGGPNPEWPNTIIDLEGVAPAQVSSNDWIIS